MKNNVTSSSDRSTTGRFKQLSNILQIVILTFSITFILLLWHLFDNNLKTSSLVIYAVILCSCLVMYMFYWMQKAKYEAIERAEAEFSGLIQRFSFAADSAGIGVWEYLVPENQLIWDKWMYVLYGVREEDFSGAYQAWQHGLHPEDRDRGDDAINSALQGEKDFIIEFRVVWPTGEVRHIKASALVLRDDSGKPLRMIGVNYDITER